jgi:hypothetical protein
MSRFTFVTALAATAVMAMAQTGSYYQPAVPAASTFNGYGGFYGGTYGGGTVAGSAMQGMASVISAQGNYNLATSAAAINMTQAQKNDMENRQQWTNTYFEMRATNRAATAAERGPPPSQEQIARIAAAGMPRPLSSHEVDPVSGQVAWPDLLQDNYFAQQRAQVEQLLSKRAQYGRLGISDQNQLGAAVEAMSASLKEQVRNVPPQQYVAANNFLRSLMFSVTRT